MRNYTYNLTDTNTVTIVEADKNTPIDWTFKNVSQLEQNLKKDGFVVLIKID
jgi:hypothetical protein